MLEAASATAVCLPAAAAAGERNCIYLTRSNDGAVLINMATNRSLSFLPRDAMHPRGSASVSVSVCLSQVGVLSKRLNESSWLLACELLPTRLTLC